MASHIPDKRRAIRDVATREGLLAQRRHHHRFDGVHPVFRLIENHARRRLKHLVSHFHTAVQAVIGGHLFAQRGLVVMECRQAVEELDLRIAGQRQHRTVNLIIAEQGDTFGIILISVYNIINAAKARPTITA